MSQVPLEPCGKCGTPTPVNKLYPRHEHGARRSCRICVLMKAGVL